MNTRKIVPAVTKITQIQVNDTLAAGITHAQFTSRKVNKRSIKNQAKAQRAKEVAENKRKREDKQFDNFLFQQAVTNTEQKFTDFEKELEALQGTIEQQAPLGETFAPSSVEAPTEFLATVDVSQAPVYNHETGEFEVPEQASDAVAV